MRQFVVLGHEAPTDPEFSLDDLPGAGRIDVLCRCVTAAFLLSYGIRTDVQVFLVIRDAATIRFDGASLRHLNPDERSTAALIRNALEARSEAVGHVEVESTPGVHVSNRGLEAVLADLDVGTLVQLHAEGRPIVDASPPDEPVFVLSDHGDPTPDEQGLLDGAGAEKVSLGPEALHGNHAIAVAHNCLDTDGYQTYRS